MAAFFDRLEDSHRKFIAAQPMFFVATAPGSEGRINLSPKGLDSFRILDDRRVAYLDMMGSGNETAAHLLDNGRITIMFCSFTRNPLILRIYGKGRSIKPGGDEWDALIAEFGERPGIRQIFGVDIDSLQTSCGFGVPVMSLEHQRDTLVKWAGSKTEDELETYRRKNNLVSIDGLPTGLK